MQVFGLFPPACGRPCTTSWPKQENDGGNSPTVFKDSTCVASCSGGSGFRGLVSGLPSGSGDVVGKARNKATISYI